MDMQDSVVVAVLYGQLKALFGVSMCLKILKPGNVEMLECSHRLDNTMHTKTARHLRNIFVDMHRLNFHQRVSQISEISKTMKLFLSIFCMRSCK